MGYIEKYYDRAGLIGIDNSIPIISIKKFIIEKIDSDELMMTNRLKRIVIMYYDLKNRNTLPNESMISFKIGLPEKKVKAMLNEVCNAISDMDKEFEIITDRIDMEVEIAKLEPKPVEVKKKPTKVKVPRSDRKLKNDYNILGLSREAYSFLSANMIWRSTELELIKSIKLFLENKNVDTFEECLKYNRLRNFSEQIAKELDDWYRRL